MSQLHRIEVAVRPELRDSLAGRIATQLSEDAGIPVQSVRTIRVFTLEGEFSPDELTRAAGKLFADPISELVKVDDSLVPQVLPGFDVVFEVGFRPGVTDNVGHTAAEGLCELLWRKPADQKVYGSLQIAIQGLDASKAEAAAACLHNALIEDCIAISRTDWDAGKRLEARSRAVKSSHQPRVESVPLPDSDEELVQMSRERTLALTLEEMRAIKEYFAQDHVHMFRRSIGLPSDPTDVELEVIAQTWSEHCKHKIFNARIVYDENGTTREIKSLFKTCVRATTMELMPSRPDLISVFTDNAGIFRFDDDNFVSIKAETHNSPSALDPYGGAMTGIVGVNRDILGTGKGCRPIFNTDIFCFAPPDYDKPLPPRLMHPKRLLRGVHRGVKDGGNESGIPTVNGSIVFHERFLGKPLVFCGTGGIMPAQLPNVDGVLENSAEKLVKPGDRIVMVGGRIGKDGIHGATFSSEALTEASPVSAVQIGDPITQKKMIDFLLEARDLGLYSSVTDNGAGGLSSSIGEMAKDCGGGHIELDKAPLKYPGLDPWEIFVSEAQERMSVAVPADKLEHFMELSRRRGVESSDLGSFDDSGNLVLSYRGQVVGSLDMHFLHEGLPELVIPAKWIVPVFPEPTPADLGNDAKKDLLDILSSWNVCSKEPWVRQYDHEVQGRSVVKPFTGEKNDGPSDAAVLQPVPNSVKGLAVAHGIAPRYSDIDAEAMTEASIDEALRNLVAVGADPSTAVGLDNFCWPDPVESPSNPDGAYKAAQLVRSNEALRRVCVEYGIPLVSGKDSMKNDYGAGAQRISVPPTLLFTALATLPDVRKSVTMDAKEATDLVYVLGLTRDECGASEWFTARGFVGNNVPRLHNAHGTLALYRALHSAMLMGLVRSCHDLSDGGLGVALAETAMAGRLGIKADLSKVPVDGVTDSPRILWSESLGRLLVTVKKGQTSSFEKLMRPNPFERIGEVTADGRIEIVHGANQILSASIDEALAAWKKPFQA
ncbi:MAG: phosphoribosylformylglycinamidine synthase, PurS and PurL domain [Fibrobacterota bacterium]|jgi:phosphoribosylformylglycinamidine synthase